MLGYSGEEVQALGVGLLETLVHPDDVDRLRAANISARELADGGVLALRFRILHADGTFRWLHRRVTPFARDETGSVTQLFGVSRDITDLVEAEDRLREAALHDALTGLPNRTLLDDRLSNALARCRRTAGEIAVLFCDLDGFKDVNDNGGHRAGDAVLKVTAERLKSALRSQDTVARIGGDEFVIVLEPSIGQDCDAAGISDMRTVALTVAERIKSAVGVPIRVHGSHYAVTVSIGVSFAGDGCDPGEVLRGADMGRCTGRSWPARTGPRSLSR